MLVDATAWLGEAFGTSSLRLPLLALIHAGWYSFLAWRVPRVLGPLPGHCLALTLKRRVGIMTDIEASQLFE